MRRKPEQMDKSNTLRQNAEAKLDRAHRTSAAPGSTEQLLHELRVHQIELEMQNEALRQSQLSREEFLEHYIDFYDFSPVGYITLTDKGLITEVNLTGAALLGIARGKLPGQRLSAFVCAEDQDYWLRQFSDALKRDEKLTCELALKRSDGTTFAAQLDCLRLAKQGKPAIVRIVLTDITERKRIDEVVRDQEEFFRLIAENTEDFIAVLDLQGRRLYNNPSYARLFGDIERLKGSDSFAEIHPEDREHVKQVFADTVQTGIGMKAEYRFVLPDGSLRHMESRGGLIKNRQGQAQRVVVVSRDITERIQAEAEIRNLAFYDELTKQPNRRLLADRLAQYMVASKRSGRYCALMFLDLDNFKPLNDQYGHAAGDLLLVEAAHRISQCVREVDTISRFGGDEFVVVLSELEIDRAASTSEAGFVAEKIRAALAEPYIIACRQNDPTTVEHRCTTSIGIVVFRNHEISADNILRLADLAMYQAKQDGRNRIHFSDTYNGVMENHGK